MNRRVIILAIVLLTGAGVLAYQYATQYLEQRERQAAIAASSAILAAIKQRELTPEQQDAMVAQARSQLDDYRQVDMARATLDQVLKANPRHAAARVELARYYIKTGHIAYRDFRPGALDEAANQLELARRMARDSTDADILWGHVLYLRGAARESVRVLQKVAERGTDNPWLHQNWADALMDLSQWEAAEVHLRKAQQQYAAAGNAPKRVVVALHGRLATALAAQRKLEEADREYQSALAIEPGDGGTRINYADFLLFDRGMPDAALAEAQKLLPAGMAQRIAAAGHYAKWAMLKGKAPREAAEHLTLAKEISTEMSWIMPQAAKSIASGPALEALVQGLVSLGVSLDTKDNHGDTGLTLAAYTGNVKSVELLLEYGAQREAVDNDGLTALASAAHKGHIPVVKLLASKGAKVDPRDNQGLSLFRRVVGNGDVEMTRLLIALKADVNAESVRGHTALMAAAHFGHEEIARMLLDAGADPSAITIDKQQSAADFAAARGHSKLSAMLRTAMENSPVKRRTK